MPLNNFCMTINKVIKFGEFKFSIVNYWLCFFFCFLFFYASTDREEWRTAKKIKIWWKYIFIYIIWYLIDKYIGSNFVVVVVVMLSALCVPFHYFLDDNGDKRYQGVDFFSWSNDPIFQVKLLNVNHCFKYLSRFCRNYGFRF